MAESPEYKTSKQHDLPPSPDKPQARGKASNEDVYKLRRRIDALVERARREREESERFSSVICTTSERPKLAGYATREGVSRFAAHFGKESVAFYRAAQDVLISSVGIGTNRGARDDETDIKYARAVHAALRGGINLIDTSLNYRHQRSERAVGAGLRLFIEDNGARDATVVCTKGGYLVPGAFAENTISADTVTCGMHSMSPAFLADQLERSRRNLGLETVDIYYLHNPETQLRYIEMSVFMHRVRAAFNQLEHAVSDGFIRYYGTATWDGYRTGALCLRALVEAARQIAGDNHHFRFVQLPFNLGMQEALTRRVDGGETVLDIAAELGITVIASAPLFQAHLSRDLPIKLFDMLPGLYTDAQRAIQFVRSTPGISSVLVGMRQMTHVMENLAISRIQPPTSADELRWC